MTLRRFLLPKWSGRIGLLAGVFAVFSSAEAAGTLPEPATAPRCNAQPQFCAAIARYAQRLRLPGYALAVARNGRIVYVQTEGFADREHKTPIRADSIFPIASITKTFTAALMMRYAEAGRIKLDDYLTEYPPTGDAVAWPYNSSEIRLRHVLSHTSEGSTPGEVFTYNGNRFNYVYGVFAKLSGSKDYSRSFIDAIHAEILDPLGLRDTLTEFPDAKDHAHASRVVTPYRYDTRRGDFVADDDLLQGHRHAYPNSGMLSTIADLVRYAHALDGAELMRPASVAEMTAPFRLNRGTPSPYGLGWFSEERNGTRLNWVYGLGPSYSSFLLRVPSEKLTFVFFANSDAPTAALRLNYGNPLQFPPAALFLRHFSAAGKALPKIDADADIHTLETSVERAPASERTAALAQITGIALTQRYVEKTFREPPGRALGIAKMLYRAAPEYFRSVRPELIALLFELSDRDLIGAMDDLGAAYAGDHAIDPRISQDFGNFYDRVGLDDRTMTYRAALVAAPGYETNDATIAGAFDLGDQYFRRGNVTAGRNYYWIGIRNAVSAGWRSSFAEAKWQRLNELTHADEASTHSSAEHKK